MHSLPQDEEKLYGLQTSLQLANVFSNLIYVDVSEFSMVTSRWFTHECFPLLVKNAPLFGELKISVVRQAE